MVQGEQLLNLTPDLEADLKLGWRENNFSIEDQILFPPGFPFPPPGFPNGQLDGLGYQESELNGGIDLTWTGFTNHTILVGWSFARTEIEDAFFDANFTPSTGVPLATKQRFRGMQNFIAEDEGRFLNSFTVQDEYRVTPNVTVTVGGRYDHFDDIEDSFSPRIAGVYRITDNHIIKAQYSKAFRASLVSRSLCAQQSGPDRQPFARFRDHRDHRDGLYL